MKKALNDNICSLNYNKMNGFSTNAYLTLQTVNLNLKQSNLLKKITVGNYI